MKLLIIILIGFLGSIGILNFGDKGAYGNVVDMNNVLEEGSYPTEILFFTQGKDTLNFFVKIRKHQKQNSIIMGVDIDHVFLSSQCASDSSVFVEDRKTFDNYKFKFRKYVISEIRA